jgi:hypothetical protein
LPTHIYLNTSFVIDGKSHVSALLHGELYRQTVQPTFTASYNRKITSNFAASLNYSIINHHMNCVGVGFSAILNKVQLYMISDNIIGTINPLSGHTSHFTFGVNLLFGRPKTKKGVTDFGVQDKTLPPVDAGTEPNEQK